MDVRSQIRRSEISFTGVARTSNDDTTATPSA